MKSWAPASFAAAITASREKGAEASPRAMFSAIWRGRKDVEFYG